MRRSLAAAALAVVALAALPLRAAPPDEATKAAAREIAQEGLDLYDAGKYEAALERFLRADAMVHAPTMSLMAARSLVKLGRLVEAEQKLAAASRMQLAADASEAFHKAVADAGKEREALLARIPSVVVTVDAFPGAELAVTIDGAQLPQTTLGQKRLVDPGAHTVEARSGDTAATARVDLKEGESRAIHLDVKAAPTGGALRTAGWVTAGIGAAAAIAGAVTAGLVVAKNDALVAAGCTEAGCPLTVPQSDLDEFRTLRLVPTPLLVGGLLAAAGGAVMIVAAPGPKPATGARPAAATGLHISPVIGPGSVGLRGSF